MHSRPVADEDPSEFMLSWMDRADAGKYQGHSNCGRQHFGLKLASLISESPKPTTKWGGTGRDWEGVLKGERSCESQGRLRQLGPHQGRQSVLVSSNCQNGSFNLPQPAIVFGCIPE